jgi:hypothetical protein
MVQSARVTSEGEELWYTLPIPYNVGADGHGFHFVLTLKVG